MISLSTIIKYKMNMHELIQASRLTVNVNNWDLICFKKCVKTFKTELDNEQYECLSK